MLLEILLTFFGIIFFIALVIASLKLNKDIKKIEVAPNMPQLIIMSKRITSFTDSYCRGTIKTQLRRPNKLTYIEFFPDDVEQGDFSPRPDKKSFVINSEFIRRSPAGDSSGKREQVIILPRNTDDLPDSFKGDNTISNWTEKEGQLAFLKSTFGKTIQNGDAALLSMMEEWTRFGIPKSFIDSAKKQSKIMPKFNGDITIDGKKEGDK